MILYRKPRPEEYPVLHELIVKHVYYNTPLELSEVVQWIETEGSTSFLVKNDDLIVGFVALVPKLDGSNISMLEILVVSPEVRGKGIGKALLNHVFKYVRDRTLVSKCWTHPLKFEGEATSDILLQKLGFVVVSDYKNRWASECVSTDYCEFHTNGSCQCGSKILIKHV